MVRIILNGVEMGVVLAFLVGPVFFTILQTSVERGFWRGVLVAFGVSISDILYVTICYFGIAQILTNSKLQTYMAYAGGAILVGFGLYHVLVKSRAKPIESGSTLVVKHQVRFVVKGFLINGMTPMVLFFWVATVSLATIDFGYAGGGEFALFFGALLGTVLLTDILKAFLADRLRKLLTPRSLRLMNMILGVALIVFGGRLILFAAA